MERQETHSRGDNQTAILPTHQIKNFARMQAWNMKNIEECTYGIHKGTAQSKRKLEGIKGIEERAT